MKKILVATDFSDASINAFLYAVNLARATGAAVHLYHVYHSVQPIPESYLVYTTPDLWPSIKEKLETMVKGTGLAGSLNISISADHGRASDLILKEAAAVKADLIICGTKHTSPDLKKIFGSTATALSHKTNIPLLVVPIKVSYKTIRHIALACDSDPDTSRETVWLLKDICQRFAASLSIVLVSPDPVTAKYETLFQSMPVIDALKPYRAGMEFSKGTNITHSLLKFSNEKQIDLLVVISHKHSIFDRLIVESVTRQLVFHTDLPLLILPQLRDPIAAAENVDEEDEKEQDFFYTE